MWITDHGLVKERSFKAPRLFFFLKALNFGFNLKVVYRFKDPLNAL